MSDHAGSRTAPHRLHWGGSLLELTARRAGLRTHVVLLRDGTPIGDASAVGRVLIRLPADGEQPGEDAGAPSVLVLSALPGVISKALLLVPQPQEDTESGETAENAGDTPAGTTSDTPPDDPLTAMPKGVAELAGFARAERHLFAPPPGTFAARLLAFQRDHPKTYAARHVVLAVAKVALGLLGVAVLFQVLLRHVLDWIGAHLPRLDLPDIPWPDIDLPQIPWPDIDWPDFALPGWLLAVVATAKYWVPVLVAIGLAGREVRRRSNKHAKSGHDDPATGHDDPATGHTGQLREDGRDNAGTG
ncbi:hypothetical protein HUO13_20790 [Saccharopolyspora erythraea]|uniref:hypothetical protein n=1 Tax=Saccharopolyspora erythraea TaxID=1836 RepID=UPI001BA9357C|nr:hypothetical protein [Saccharopolyspora erythraea]QUH02928.1 hypothetical protein HUO13_20790 [Saccharopolyspora erythraea]